MSGLSRRQFVVGASAAGFGLLAGCGPLPWQASRPTRVPRIGYSQGTSAATAAANVEAFRQGLRDLGYLEGENIFIEYRWGEGQQGGGRRDHFVELAQLPVDVLVVGTAGDAKAALEVSSTLPIVVAGSPGPEELVEAGLAASYARPGGTVTGLANPPLVGKHLQLLQEILPSASDVALLWSLAITRLPRQQYESAARSLGIRLHLLEVRAADEFEAAIETARQRHMEGLYDVSSPLSFVHRARIAELATRHGLPTVHNRREHVEAGGLLAYQPRVTDSYRRAASYVGKILRGARPADLPIEQPMRFDFVVNLKTARELGIIFPNEIMLQVTEVIDQ